MERLRELFRLYYNKTATKEQKMEFMFQVQNSPPEELSLLITEHGEQLQDTSEALEPQQAEKLLASILAKETAPAVRSVRTSTPFLRKWGWVAAASIILILVVGNYFRSNNSRKADTAEKAPVKDIPAGKTGAILTLADGSRISLDTFKNATVALQGGVTAKVVDGSLIYEGKGNAIAYNTMSTPKGRQFRLTLPDGTQVWLNAASSVRYPIAFTGNQRLVEMTGEAYFEVAKNPVKPFLVNVNGKAEVQVLGTSFNLNAYDNESSMHTTLLEGSIAVAVSFDGQPKSGQLGQKIKPESGNVILKPGQQARLFTGQQTTAIKVIDDVDMDKVMAWKNGLFNFNGLSFTEIMKQLERWYDIKVVYENNTVPNKRLAGEMTRGVSLNGLLKQLGEMGVRYQLNDRTLLILQ